jgi:hypothetical protein
MEPDDKIQDQERKIKNLELELNDLREGLTVVVDYYRDLRQVSRQQVARKPVEQEAFEFVFARMENPSPSLGNGEWTGYSLRPDRV